MNRQDCIKELMHNWAEARYAVNENTSMLIESDFGPTVMEECAARMKVLHHCEAELMELHNWNHQLPQALQNFINARLDKGCPMCWLSSSHGSMQHEECQRKIDRYFLTETELFKYARAACQPELTDS